MAGVKIVFRDINEHMVAALGKFFPPAQYPDVSVSRGDIFAVPADAIVCAANSFGIMEGYFSAHFGWQLQHRLQRVIREQWHGEIPVGCAQVIPAYPQTADDRTFVAKQPDPFPMESPGRGEQGSDTIHWLVNSPTMRAPEIIANTCNSFLAFRAALIAVEAHNEKARQEGRTKDVIKSLLCCGLGTSFGKMNVSRSAFQMEKAYRSIVCHEGLCPPTRVLPVVTAHRRLCEFLDVAETEDKTPAEQNAERQLLQQVYEQFDETSWRDSLPNCA